VKPVHLGQRADLITSTIQAILSVHTVVRDTLTVRETLTLIEMQARCKVIPAAHAAWAASP